MTKDLTLVDVLRSGRQADPDGVEVRISRQAVEEAANEIERLRGQLSVLNNGYKYPTEVCKIAREALAGGHEPSYHVDPTGKTRESPHCRSCSCFPAEPRSQSERCKHPNAIVDDVLAKTCPDCGELV